MTLDRPDVEVVLADTSAWVEYLRATGSPTHLAMRSLLASSAQGTDASRLAVTDIVVLEVLAGARDEAEAVRLRRMLLAQRMLPTVGLADYETAAAAYRLCRRAGETVRSYGDCLIAAVATRTGSEVLHADRDFDVLSRCTGLRSRRS